MSTPSIESSVTSSVSQIESKWLILAAVVCVMILLCLCRNNTPSIVGLTVEQAKRRLKETEYSVGDKIGFLEPLDGKDLGKIAEQTVDKEQKKINYKMYQIDVQNIDEYARLAKEKAKQARQMAMMQADLERAMRAAPPPLVEEVVVEQPSPVVEQPPPVVEQPPPVVEKKRRVVDMGFGAGGLSVRKKNKAPTEGFFW